MNDNACRDDGMNRRKFLALATAVVTAGCSGVTTTSGPSRVIDAGPAEAFATDGVYDKFRNLGFFLIRKEGKLSALSAICTHRKCTLDAETDRSFYCHCHGSTFDPAGKVTAGPATRNLPALETAIDARGHLMVTVPA
ncbi:MAG TPA: Rieske (2Fe-2S) protein [Chthoniobacteraceae bacterium]|nr:Rieske (2Fe-2S) protein [Chthoniobacteraceae bacterium]